MIKLNIGRNEHLQWDWLHDKLQGNYNFKVLYRKGLRPHFFKIVYQPADMSELLAT